jgi:hypothetical protein
MTLPANVRVNTQVPFPALVQGSGPVTVTKINGIWTIGFAPQLLGIQNPPTNLAADLAIVWDPIAKTFILTPLAGLLISTTRLQRSIIVAGDLPVQVNDAILNINAAADLMPIVPAAATRAGVPLTFKNKPTSHSQTLTRTGADTFDGQNALPLYAGAAITLVPYNDGVNTGYAIE